MTDSELRERIAATRQAQGRLMQRRVDDVIDVVDAVVDAWLSPGSLWMQRALDALPQDTGFSAPMLAHGLPLQLQPLRGVAIRRLLDRELGDRARLDSDLAKGTTFLVHVLAGNIPALAASPLLLSLALKRAVLLKPAAGDRIFPNLLVESLASMDPELAECAVVAYWPGGTLACEKVAFEHADVVVASGSDASIAALRARVGGRFIGHGHKVSLAVIAREELATAAQARQCAAQLAYDVTLWDQQGCLSPQLAYIEEGAGIDILGFAEMLSQALAQLAQELPPRQLDLSERAAILKFRQEAEWNSDADVRLLASRGSTEWTIRIDSDPTFLPTCLNRCLRLNPIANLGELTSRWQAPPHLLEAAGVAAPVERTQELSRMLLQAGVHRVCSLGTMQTPDLEWCPGGRPRVREWI